MALTRLLVSSVCVRPSLRKIELMWFSTARLVSTRDSAMAALLLPEAISERIWCSQRCELGQRRVLAARPRFHQGVDDLGVDDRPARGDFRDRGCDLHAVVHPAP